MGHIGLRRDSGGYSVRTLKIGVMVVKVALA